MKKQNILIKNYMRDIINKNHIIELKNYLNLFYLFIYRKNYINLIY